MSHCTVYAITNQKGGVGKTTTTVNLGIGLAKAGKKVLLIDFDPQASLTASLGYKQPDELDDTISTVLEHSISDKPMARDYAILHHDEGVDFIPSNIELSELEVRLINTMSREQALREYLDSVKENYDYILIDCMPSLGVITINALVAADRVIIPTQPNYLSAKGLDLLAQSIRRVQRRLNPQLEIAGTLFTMVDNRTNHARSVIEALRSVQYRITETDAASGYSLLAEPLAVGALPHGDVYDVSITICNTQNLQLPFTGGNGFSIPILFAALALMAGVFYCKKSIYNKENN